ncbi:MAG: DUF4326 domain-containing protein [Nocardioidaceae bacterium]
MGRPPRRVRLQRTRGWRKPDGVVVVSRPSRWGNPFAIGELADGSVRTRAEAIELFRDALMNDRLGYTMADVRRELAGKDLACWCPYGEPCHADLLIEVANET